MATDFSAPCPLCGHEVTAANLDAGEDAMDRHRRRKHSDMTEDEFWAQALPVMSGVVEDFLKALEGGLVGRPVLQGPRVDQTPVLPPNAAPHVEKRCHACGKRTWVAAALWARYGAFGVVMCIPCIIDRVVPPEVKKWMSGHS